MPSIKNLGTTHNVSMDFKTLDVLAYASIVIGRSDLSKELLMAGGQSEETADNAIASTIERIREAQPKPEVEDGSVGEGPEVITLAPTPEPPAPAPPAGV